MLMIMKKVNSMYVIVFLESASFGIVNNVLFSLLLIFPEQTESYVAPEIDETTGECPSTAPSDDSVLAQSYESFGSTKVSRGMCVRLCVYIDVLVCDCMCIW